MADTTFYKPQQPVQGYDPQTVFNAQGQPLSMQQYLAQGGQSNFSNVQSVPSVTLNQPIGQTGQGGQMGQPQMGQTPQSSSPFAFGMMMLQMENQYKNNNALMDARNTMLNSLYGMPISQDQLSKLDPSLQKTLQSGNKNDIEMQIRLINDQITGRANTFDQSIQYLSTAYNQQIQQAEKQKQDSIKVIEDALTRYGSAAFKNVPDSYKRQLEQTAGYPAGYLDNIPETIAEKRAEVSAELGQERIAIEEARLALAQEKARTTGGTGQFSKTQISKGATNANMSLADFKNLDVDTQNFFINNKAALDAVKQEIDAATQDPNTDWDAIGKEIDGSDLLPDEAKNELWDYLNKARSKTQTTAIPPSTTKWYNPLTWF